MDLGRIRQTLVNGVDHQVVYGLPTGNRAVYEYGNDKFL
jgi:hypothetical protein